MIHEVRISSKARKQLRKVPAQVRDALDVWIDLVEEDGLEQVRKIPGFHDEPLKGERTGQRSIRLNIAYRAIYIVVTAESGETSIKFVSVEEVTKHKY